MAGIVGISFLCRRTISFVLTFLRRCGAVYMRRGRCCAFCMRMRLTYYRQCVLCTSLSMSNTVLLGLVVAECLPHTNFTPRHLKGFDDALDPMLQQVACWHRVWSWVAFGSTFWGVWWAVRLFHIVWSTVLMLHISVLFQSQGHDRLPLVQRSLHPLFTSSNYGRTVLSYLPGLDAGSLLRNLTMDQISISA